MEEPKPLQTVPSSHNNTTESGPHLKIENGEVDEEKRVVVVEMKEELEKNHPLITEAQRRELYHQVFIFNHFAYNLPLPHYLLQFPTNNNSEYGRFCGSDHMTMVDQEPHRCRRTDGKKWRCGKNTVPNQKYCERHMHRGRNRSRKLVETSQVNSLNLKTKPNAKLVPNIESSVSNVKPLVIQQCDTFLHAPSRSICVVNTPSPCNRLRNVTDSDVTVVTAFGGATSLTSDMTSCVNVCKQDEEMKKCISNNMSIKNGSKGSISCKSNGVSNGIGFSPKSVLQVSGCNEPYINNRNSIEEPEHNRCRRTDGKKWRCKSAILPGQKYCATHMHRGAKRRFTNNESPPFAVAVTTAISSAVTIAQLPYTSAETDCRVPNTKLSMSVPASAPLEKSSGSSDSDDTSTTITDSYLSF